MDPLSLTLGITALLGTTTKVLGYLNDVKTASKERAELASETAYLLALLTSMRYKVEEVEQGKSTWYNSIRSLLGGTNGPLDQFRSALEQLAEKLAPATSLKKPSRTLIWTLDKKECNGTLVKIERIKSLIGLALQDDHFKLAQAIKVDTASIPAIGSRVAEIKKGVDGLQLGEDVKRRRAIVEWLSPLNFFATQDDIFSRRQNGTGQWLLESSEFRDWLSGAGKLLWCPGIPGAGKTILASIVVNWLREQFKDKANFGIACIYCNYKEKDAQTPVNLIASLLIQLVEDRGSLSTDVINLYQKCVNRGTRPPLSEVSKVLHSEIAKYSKVFVVLDALDECFESDGARKLFLTEMRRLIPNISLLVTSRNIANIELEFQKAIRLEIRASDEDVRSYLKSRIKGQPQLVRYIEKDATLQDAILDTIVKKANGMFLLAQLHMDSLAREDNRKGVRKTLKNLPEELNETYDNAMQRIQSQNHQQVKRAKQVLSWISYAVRPLAIKEIQCAVAVEHDDTEMDEEALPDEDLLVSVCAGLVTIDRESNIIRLVHYTTQDYFQRIRMSRFPNAQTEIARICLTYLLFDTFAEGYCSSDTHMETRLQENPLLRYAALHWGNHARGGPEEAIQELVLRFLEEKSKLSCSVQVMHISKYQNKGYSQKFPRNVAALQVAASFGLEEITGVLLEMGAEAAAEDSRGWTALHWAAEGGHEAVVRLLLQAGAAVDAKAKNGGMALHQAACGGHEAVVQLLLQTGAAVDARTENGWTALHWAAIRGYEAVVQLLIQTGITVDAKTEDGGTALHWAAGSGREAVVQLLLQAGATVDMKAKDGWTVLRAAGSRRKELHAKAKNGRTALHWAAGGGHEAVVELLLQAGATVDAKTENGRTALHQAAGSGYEAVVRLLLQAGAMVNAKTENGGTALTRQP